MKYPVLVLVLLVSTRAAFAQTQSVSISGREAKRSRPPLMEWI